VSSDSKPKRPVAFVNSTPLPDSKELGEHTGWALWEQAVQKTEQQFANTDVMPPQQAPVTGSGSYAPTEPAGLHLRAKAAKPAPVAPRAVTFEQVSAEARKANRVSPKPRRWAELYGNFSAWAPGKRLPPPVLGDAAWRQMSALAKRMSFRQHLEWAFEHGCLAELHDFLKALPEEDWHHTDDEP